MIETNDIFKKIPYADTIPKYLAYVSERYLDSTAIKENKGRQVEEKSYVQLKKDVDKLSFVFSRLKFRNEKIALMGPPSYCWWVFYFGIVSSSNIVVPIDDGLRFQEIERQAKLAEVSALVYDEENEKTIQYLKQANKSLKATFCLQELDKLIEGTNSFYKSKMKPQKEDLAMIVFTSGTTGGSKGVMLTHKNICDNIYYSAFLLGMKIFQQEESIFSLLPLYHMFGVTAGFLIPLYYGLTICIAGEEKNIVRNLKVFQPSIMVVVPMIAEGIDKLLKEGLEEVSGNLRLMISGGATMDEKICERFHNLGITILNGYGITECSPVVSCNRIEKNKVGSVGLTIPSKYCEVKIEDGEILVRGSIVSKGYYNDEVSTRDMFVGEWFKTGDLGYMDDENYLYLTGRKKNLIIRKDGNNVSPEELEKFIKQHPLVDSVLVTVQNIQNREILVAIIQPNDAYAVAEKIENLQAALEDAIKKMNLNLPIYKQIQRVVVTENRFEKTALGKVKRYKHLNGGRV